MRLETPISLIPALACSKWIVRHCEFATGQGSLSSAYASPTEEWPKPRSAPAESRLTPAFRRQSEEQ